jgi:prevent-host-death family protein
LVRIQPGVDIFTAMKQVNIDQAKKHLSKLLEEVAMGEEFVIARAGKPIARLVPMNTKPQTKRRPGALKGKTWIAEDFDKMTPEELEEWYDSPIFPRA